MQSPCARLVRIIPPTLLPRCYARRPRRTRGGRGVRYARTIVNALHVGYACMQPPCARLVRIMPPTYYLASAPDLRFCRLRGRFSILGIWLVQLLPWLRFRVLHTDAENWA
jgi:hypothetical protein